MTQYELGLFPADSVIDINAYPSIVVRPVLTEGVLIGSCAPSFDVHPIPPLRAADASHAGPLCFELMRFCLTMFEKIPLDQLLAQTRSDEIQPVSDNQLILFA